MRCKACNRLMEYKTFTLIINNKKEQIEETLCTICRAKLSRDMGIGSWDDVDYSVEDLDNEA